MKAASKAWERQRLESTVMRKMDITPDAKGSSQIVRDMSLDQLKDLVKSLKSWGGKRGGKIMQGYKAGGKV